MTSATSAIAVDIASDKDLTTRLLGAAGLPVPKQESVRTADQAVTVARRIGFPVVVKPLDGNHGRGVCLDLHGRRRRPGGVPDRRGPVAARHGHRRELRDRQGLPLPDHRRPAGRGRRAGAGARRRRREVHGPAAGRPDQRRPAPRRRPREGADPDQGRQGRRRAPRVPGPRPWTRCRTPARGQADPHRQHVHRWHLDRPDLRGAPGEHRDRRGGGPDGRAGHRRHRLHLPRHHRAGPRDRRRDLRGQRGSRVPDAHAPDDRRPAVHLQAGRRHALPARGTRAGSRSSPSPAPTARRRPRG